MKTIPVAAVYDRREENELGSHRQPPQEDQSIVAAVYDRRPENDSGSHRQPLQWAVCDCREESESDAPVAQLEV
jgi:hypothetical protein